MNGGAICWRSKLQSIVALSSTEAEYVRATPAMQEILWLKDLLCKLGINDSSPLILNMDNQGAVSILTSDIISFVAMLKKNVLRFSILQQTRWLWTFLQRTWVM